jgi:hypothetical protein
MLPKLDLTALKAINTKVSNECSSEREKWKFSCRGIKKRKTILQELVVQPFVLQWLPYHLRKQGIA